MKIKIMLVVILVLSMVMGGSPSVQINAEDEEFGFERTVVAELETATWCGYCPYAERALHSMEDDYDENWFVVVSHHYKDALSQTNSTSRLHEYGAVPTPTTIFNGNTSVQGGDPDTKTKYKTKVLFQLLRDKPPFLVHLKGDIQEDHLKLNAYVLGWDNLPEDLHYTFMICSENAKTGGRNYRWVCRDVLPKPAGQPFSMDEFSTREFELNWNIPKGVNWRDLYAVFLVESFKHHDIYQAGIWKKNKFQVEKFDTPLGKFFKESPEELRITFSKYKMTKDGIWDLIDEDGMVYPSTGEFDKHTLVIKPKSPLPYGKKYCVYIHSGRGSIGTSSTFLLSPAFLQFEVGKDPTPPPPPKDPPKLSLSTLGIDLKTIEDDNQKIFEFEITNKGDDPLSGNISAECDWVNFDKTEFSEIIEEPLKIKGTVDTSKLDPGLEHSCTINITSNGGDGKIGLKLELPLSPPILEVSPKSLVFESGNISETQTVQIKNLGQAELIGTVEVGESWIKINKDEFTGETKVEVSVNTDSLEAGEHTGEIKFESNGGEEMVDVRVVVPEKITKIELMYGSKLAVVDGEIFEMAGEPYLSPNDTLMLDLGSVAELFGLISNTTGIAFTINNSDKDIIITATIGNKVANIKYGNKIAVPVTMPYAPTAVFDRYYIPFTFFIQIFDVKVDLLISGEPVYLPEPKPDPKQIELVIGSKIAIVDGEKVQLEMHPTIVEGRTIVPLRFITETFGFEVGWNGDTKEITLTKDTLQIILKVGVKNVKVIKDDETEMVELNPAPIIIESSTMVPIRFISDVLSAEISWNAEEKKIIIVYQP